MTHAERLREAPLARFSEDLGLVEQVSIQLAKVYGRTAKDNQQLEKLSVDLRCVVADARGRYGEAALRWLEAVEKRSAAAELEQLEQDVAEEMGDFECRGSWPIETQYLRQRVASLRAQADALEAKNA